MKIIFQRDAMDCGPTCLMMIAEHYGAYPDREEVRQSCALGKQGVSLLGISKTAEKLGFKTLGGRVSFDTLVEDVPLPCIVHWGQNHFVVVHKIKRSRRGKVTIYVADPGKGLLTYDKEEFCSHWISTQTRGEEKGIVLLFEPTNALQTGKITGGRTESLRGRLGFLWRYLRRYSRYFGQLILGLLLGSVLQLVL